MYVDVLSSAVGVLPSDLSGGALLDWTRSRRTDMHRVISTNTGPSFALLVAEVAFDRALLKLCEMHDIASDPANFLHPAEERARLETELTIKGIDLAEERPRFEDD